MSATKAAKAKERIKRHMRKLWALSNDERGNPNQRESAKRKLEALGKKHGISVEEVMVEAQDSFDSQKFNIKIIATNMKRIPFELRMIALLLSEHFGVDVIGGGGPGGNVVIKFVIPKPNDVEVPAKAFKVLMKLFREGWKRFEREVNQYKNSPSFMRDLSGVPKSAHRKSFMSGIYNGYRVRLAKDKKSRIKVEAPLRERLGSAEKMRREAIGQLAAPAPEPPNPFALMVINKPKVKLEEPKAVTKRKKKKETPPPPPEEEPKLADDFCERSFRYGADLAMRTPMRFDEQVDDNLTDE